MSEAGKAQAPRAPWLRAGRHMLGAVLSPSGASWAHPRRGPGRASLVAALILGGVAAAALTTGIQLGILPGTGRAATEAVVRDYILDHPEIITQAMDRLQARRTAALVDENRAALETPFAGAWEGAARPSVTLVAFMDYACTYCRASLSDIARLLREEPGLRVVYHELPILAQGSVTAARASLFAAEQGKFPAFHKAMFVEGGVGRDQILAAAGEAGLDLDRVRAEMDSSAHNATIAANVQLAQTLDAQGTPLFVVGDQIFYGAVGYDSLKAAVDAARKNG